MLSRIKHLFRPKWPILTFPQSGPPMPTPAVEETLPDYLSTRYHPTVIGQVFNNRYQVVGKLGFGGASIIWLARDLEQRRHVALKVGVHKSSLHKMYNEGRIYARMPPSKHPGREAIRPLLDSFDVEGPTDVHPCLVHPVLFEDLHEFMEKTGNGQRMPLVMSATILQQVFRALDYLHTECKVIHTDIKTDNLMFPTTDESVFTKVENAWMKQSIPRRTDETGRIIYPITFVPRPASKDILIPVLCDFSASVAGDEDGKHIIQGEPFRAPEVLLEIPWSYSVDVWNTACMAWHLIHDIHLFPAPAYTPSSPTTHLASIINLIGPPPASLLARSDTEHFPNGEFIDQGLLLRQRETFADRQQPRDADRTKEFFKDAGRTSAEGRELQRLFMALIEKAIRWDPAERATAGELADDDFFEAVTDAKPSV